ncbi:hypothetical protein [Leifsonia poae]|uniref:hypothetical protein n=1 Tax=Leifsonia poae TaxID=110933 RepID=UPI001CBB3DC1|nr:hypothetical protein [Leifsonia poae]
MKNRETTLVDQWTDMWNLILPATQVVAADARVYFGRQPATARATVTTSAAELQSVVEEIQTAIPGIRYGHRSAPTLSADSDQASGLITLLWEVAAPGVSARSGIDLLRYRDDRITEVWSITGDLELPPLD